MSRRRQPAPARRGTAPGGDVVVAYGPALRRAVPGLLPLAGMGVAAAWVAGAAGWSAFAVVAWCLADAAADGWFARRRALAALAAGDAGDGDGRLVAEFVRTYFWVVATMGLTAYLALSGALLRPRAGEAPAVWGAFRSWPFWALVAAAVAVRGFRYWWDHVRGGDAQRLPAATAVSEPLRRLFVLQFGVLAGAVLVYWLAGSSTRWLAAVLALKAAADLVLAVLERARAARVAAALRAGLVASPPRRPRPRPRGGRRRR